MRVIMCLILAACLVGCSTPTSAEPPPSTPAPEVSASPEAAPIPTSPYRGDVTLQDRTSPVVWPDDSWQLSSEDFVSVSDWIGGVAGTDSTELKVQGDGTVTLTSQRQPGNEEPKTSSGKLDPEETRAVFRRLKESKLLEQDESHGGTTGSTLSVSIKGVQDRVSVAGRRGQADTILGSARNALKSE